MLKAQAVLMHPADNTATAVELVEAGSEIVMTAGGELKKVYVCERIGFGHKFAIAEIPKGSRIVKYGETIGIATQDIKPGQHVHVHNLESGRGRGDR